MQVVTAINGEDAMEALEEDTWPDIVFLDYHMGLGESGDEVRVTQRLGCCTAAQS